MNKKVIIIGAGGHAKVIADIILKNNDIVIGFLDDGKEINTPILNYKVLGKTSDCIKYIQDCEFIIGIGSNNIREQIASTYNLNWYTAIHPTATIAIDVSIGVGSTVMAGAIINTSAIIGKHCVINTGAIVEHDNVIDDYVHISPNAVLCGTVHVGKLTHIGAGSTVKNNTNITSHCTIGAGAVVVKDIIEKGTYVGIPAKKLY